MKEATSIGGAKSGQQEALDREWMIKIAAAKETPSI